MITTMSGVVSVCPIHGTFESRSIHIENAVNVTIINGKEDCPKCGATSNIMEGRFTFADGIVKVLSSPQWTVDALLDAHQALQDLDLSRVRTPREAIRKLEKSSPAAAELLQKVKGQPWTRSDKLSTLSLVVGSLIGILGLVLGQLPKDAEKPSTEEIARITKIVMEQTDASKN